MVVVGNHTLLSDACATAAAVTAGGDVDSTWWCRSADDELDVGFWRGRALAERIIEPGVELTVDVGVGIRSPSCRSRCTAPTSTRCRVDAARGRLGGCTPTSPDGSAHLRVPVEVVTAEG